MAQAVNYLSKALQLRCMYGGFLNTPQPVYKKLSNSTRKNQKTFETTKINLHSVDKKLLFAQFFEPTSYAYNLLSFVIKFIFI